MEKIVLILIIFIMINSIVYGYNVVNYESPTIPDDVPLKNMTHPTWIILNAGEYIVLKHINYIRSFNTYVYVDSIAYMYNGNITAYFCNGTTGSFDGISCGAPYCVPFCIGNLTWITYTGTIVWNPPLDNASYIVSNKNDTLLLVDGYIFYNATFTNVTSVSIAFRYITRNPYPDNPMPLVIIRFDNMFINESELTGIGSSDFNGNGVSDAYYLYYLVFYGNTTKIYYYTTSIQKTERTLMGFKDYRIMVRLNTTTYTLLRYIEYYLYTPTVIYYANLTTGTTSLEGFNVSIFYIGKGYFNLIVDNTVFDPIELQYEIEKRITKSMNETLISILPTIPPPPSDWKDVGGWKDYAWNLFMAVKDFAYSVYTAFSTIISLTLYSTKVFANMLTVIPYILFIAMIGIMLYSPTAILTAIVSLFKLSKEVLSMLWRIIKAIVDLILGVIRTIGSWIPFT